MPNYKEMYLKMVRASEEAINVIITAQRECEENYMEYSKPELSIVSLPEIEPND